MPRSSTCRTKSASTRSATAPSRCGARSRTPRSGSTWRWSTPGVGTARRPIALRVARGDVLIGPDNGLLVPAAERLGGVVEARLLENPAYRLPLVTSTFHGRDVFAPAAAHLARGASLRVPGQRDRRRARRVADPRGHGRRWPPGDRGDLRGHVRQPQAVRAGGRRPRCDGRRSGRGGVRGRDRRGGACSRCRGHERSGSSGPASRCCTRTRTGGRASRSTGDQRPLR